MWRRFTKLLHLGFTSPPCPDLLHHVSPAANDTSRIFADIFTQLDRIKELLNAKEKKDRERRAAVRLQAAARGFLARRRAQALHAAKASEEQAAVRLQAAGRGFLARHVVRNMRMLLSSSLPCVFIPSASPIRPAAPIEGEVQVWALPVQCTRSTGQHQASMAMAVSLMLGPAVVLDASNVRARWITLHPSAPMRPAEALFPWDLGGHSYLHILVANKNSKPRCKRLNPRSRLIGLRQLSSSRTSWVSKGRGDVMDSQRAAWADRLIVRPSYLYKFSYLCICNLFSPK